MTADFDVIIVGSGPAGVSAAFPLVAAGKKVLMVDGGNSPAGELPRQPFLAAREYDQEQWKWMIGSDLHALGMHDAISPKMRVPAHAKVFSEFNTANHINSENFVAIGSLAQGGLSNAWGCGVARFSSAELEEFPCLPSELENAYRLVAQRIGISGPKADDLSDYFGLDSWSQPPIAMDALHERMYSRYEKHRQSLNGTGFRLGRSRIAVLSQDLGRRQGCNNQGNCLYGCDRGALYSASTDLAALKLFPNFYHQTMVVDALRQGDGHWLIEGAAGKQAKSISGSRILLAAGTLATTRLALNALQLQQSVRLLSCPTAAFVLCLPSSFGAARHTGFGLGQLSFVLSLRDDIHVLGSTFATSGLPISEFVNYLPLRRRYGVDLLKALLSSCVVGNLFLPGNLSDNYVSVDGTGALHIKGGFKEETGELLKTAGSRLRKAYAQLGAYMLPMSFTPAKAGADIHYAGTLPMRINPVPGETGSTGELFGLAGVHVVDGAALPLLSEKSHTLTIMANATRIGERLAVGYHCA
jgi:choline dehydrogenase-like flavoprotein